MDSDSAAQFPERAGELDRATLMPGFANDFETEALPGALPVGQNSPQRCAYGLYAEQLSGSPFTAPRGANERSWLYRIRPSVKHSGRYRATEMPLWRSAPDDQAPKAALGQYRWSPIALPAEALTFVTGMRTMTTAGDCAGQSGIAAHVALVTAPMEREVFWNADAEMLILVQEGRLTIRTELGLLQIGCGEIAVVPRGMMAKYIPHGPVRAFVCENYGAKFTLPERGPIGANCLANARDFKTPCAAFEDLEEPHLVTVKWGGAFHRLELAWSPLDVVAWHGNYAPYQYDLRHFSPVGAIGFDHPDPSIFTVLTAPTESEGTANVDFLIFPERWMVAEHSFRPPWYHRNVMSEVMGNVMGEYDAKPDGFPPGGLSLHNCMLPHGPDEKAFDAASRGALAPKKLENTLAFMLETRLPQTLTRYAIEEAPMQDDYHACWSGLKKRFNGTPEGDWS